ncbi:hypothetical protein [Nostoc sp. 'Peltigera malacea cyanobiont' DB3992]|uniref:hypothetical protein n=1 Tax=Nostoc sp. 'Peltigera malacea cyanobiont' DB3992 TaxID=1206980 RepID=UPI000C040D8C|nr:hypothetical protein [Nostoc sp. 'Peltigera malacea cyanobiont' DB3992]PHM05968.1 hypothetical protein CK516_37040 [Nostoc sp. 'Peltigera malacea cyanobiont' DB3992]
MNKYRNLNQGYYYAESTPHPNEKYPKRTSNTAAAPTQGMFQSRPFVVQAQQAENSQQTNLKTSLMQADNYGHHLSKMQLATVSAQAIQSKDENETSQKTLRHDVSQVIQRNPNEESTPNSLNDIDPEFQNSLGIMRNEESTPNSLNDIDPAEFQTG